METTGRCPPHWWEVTAAADGSAKEHHRCLRCGAERDLPEPRAPFPGGGERRPWRSDALRAWVTRRRRPA